jgi:hypothetical protein
MMRYNACLSKCAYKVPKMLRDYPFKPLHNYIIRKRLLSRDGAGSVICLNGPPGVVTTVKLLWLSQRTISKALFTNGIRKIRCRVAL